MQLGIPVPYINLGSIIFDLYIKNEVQVYEEIYIKTNKSKKFDDKNE